MMLRSLVLVLIQVTLFAFSESPAFVPTYVYYEPSTDGLIYVLNLNIGSPSSNHKLAVDFDEDDILVTGFDLDSSSSSYSPVDGGTDLVKIFGKWYRAPVRSLPYPHSLRSRCPSCQGIFGMGQGSFVWTLWPYVTFSRGKLLLGGSSPVFQSESSSGCSYSIMQCSSMSSGVCTSRVEAEGRFYDMSFSSSYESRLPEEVFSSFSLGKSVYSAEAWEDLHLKLPAAESATRYAELAASSPSLYGEPCTESARMSIRSGSVITSDNRGLRKLRIAGEGDSISAGVSVWKDWEVFVDRANGFVALRASVGEDHLSGWNLAMFLACLWLYIRSKTADTAMRLNNLKNARSNCVNIVYILLGVLIAFSSFEEREARAVMATAPGLSIYVGISHSFCTLFTFACSALAATSKGPKGKIRFRLNLIKDALYEHMVLTAAWVTLVPRSSDGVSSLPCVLVNAVTIYNLTYYLLVVLTYFVYSGVRGMMVSAPFTLTVLFVIPILYIAQSWLACVYFVRPYLLTVTASFGTGLATPIIMMGYALIVDSALYTIILYERRASWKMIVGRLENGRDPRLCLLRRDSICVRCSRGWGEACA
jgi:hypothetical protein